MIDPIELDKMNIIIEKPNEERTGVCFAHPNLNIGFDSREQCDECINFIRTIKYDHICIIIHMIKKYINENYEYDPFIKSLYYEIDKLNYLRILFISIFIPEITKYMVNELNMDIDIIPTPIKNKLIKMNQYKSARSRVIN